MKVLKFSGLKLRLAAVTQLFYDSDTETMYVDNKGVIYQYNDIPFSAWMLIKSGDADFFDTMTAAIPYKIVPKLPRKKLDSYMAPAPSVVLWLVDSSNVKYVGYDSDTNKLYVQFLSGDVYVYYDVEPEIWNGLRQADSKGSFLHWFIKVNNYRYEKIGGFGLDYSTNYLTPNSGTAHPDGYLTGF